MTEITRSILDMKDVGESIKSISQDIGMVLHVDNNKDISLISRVKHARGLVENILSVLVVLTSKEYTSLDRHEELCNEVRKIEFSCTGLQSILSQSLINIALIDIHKRKITYFLKILKTAANRIITLSFITKRLPKGVEDVEGTDKDGYNGEGLKEISDNGLREVNLQENNNSSVTELYEVGIDNQCYKDKSTCEQECNGVCLEDKCDGVDVPECGDETDVCYRDKGTCEQECRGECIEDSCDEIDVPKCPEYIESFTESPHTHVENGHFEQNENGVAAESDYVETNILERISRISNDDTSNNDQENDRSNFTNEVSDANRTERDEIYYTNNRGNLTLGDKNYYESNSENTPSLTPHYEETTDESTTPYYVETTNESSTPYYEETTIGSTTAYYEETTTESTTPYYEETTTESTKPYYEETTTESTTSYYEETTIESTMPYYKETTTESTTPYYEETTTEFTTPFYETTTQDLYKVSQDIYSAAQDLSSKANEISSMTSDISSRASSISSMVSDLNTYDDDELSKKIQAVSKITQEISSKTSEISSLCSTTSSLASDISSASSDMPSADRHHRFKTSPWQKMSAKCQEMVTSCQAIVTTAQDILFNVDNIISYTADLKVADAVSTGVYDITARTQLVISETLNIVSAAIELMNVIEQ